MLSATLASGCHARFKKHVPSIDTVEVRAVTLSGPDVDLGRVTGAGVLSAAYNITQMVREGNIAAHIGDKVSPDQVNQAFVQGFREELGDGPPFSSSNQADARLQFELVDWGMQMTWLGSPGVYNYNVVVRGYGADGRAIYRTSYQCYTDAGASGWVEMSPFVGADNPDKIKNVPAEKIQAIFDATAYDCGRQFVWVLRRHAE